jgi:GTP-binding protein Era
VINISVIKNKNLEIVLEEIKKNLDYGPKYFEDEILTQTNERDLTCELIREKILKLINKEIPHGIFIENNIFKRRQDKKIFDLEFFVYCERESHKKILIGSNGSMIKKISTESRIEIEKFLNSKINLKLWIKVKKNWRNNDFYIKKFID